MSLNGGKFNNYTKRSNIEPSGGLGLELRTRAKAYKEMDGVARSIYYQSQYINTTERSFGMPQNSGQDIFTRLSTAGGLQVSSTSANDTSAGTGARSLYIQGILYNNGYWKQKTSVVVNLNGQTNEGDIYVSPLGQSTTLGVPDANIIHAVQAGYSNSTGGIYSVPYGMRWNYTYANYYSGSPQGSATLVLHEYFYQDFNGTGDTDNMTKYEVGYYNSQNGTFGSFNATGGAPYTALTDILLNVFVTSGSTTIPKTAYIEYIQTEDSKSNIF